MKCRADADHVVEPILKYVLSLMNFFGFVSITSFCAEIELKYCITNLNLCYLIVNKHWLYNRRVVAALPT